jgi:hypothetical protein
MINGFKVITLCGSTRFKEEFMEAQKRLTLEGNIVISVGLFGHSGDDVVWTEGVKDMLDRQHLAKIDLADEIFVINVGGYIGDSTRREIAYAEYRGKTISYLEEPKKASIYDNSIAIGELHDSGKLSDEDWEKASHYFAEKREALVADYNACKGPWPYQWGNADVVVCGILQRFGLVSCDFYDLKYIYEANRIYEIRIKGKGTNEEEQVQSIIDIIRNDYMDLLQSSKKLAVTIIDSNRGAHFNKIADCLSGMDVIWHEWGATADEKNIALSIVAIMDTNLQFKLREWSKWTLESYLSEVKRVGEDVARSFYNQSDLSRVKDCELMIIGINPGAGCPFSQWGLKDRALSNSDFLYWGNPCFQGLSNKEIIYEMSQKYDKDKKRYGWDLWHKIHKMLGYAGKGELIEKPDKFVLTNMIFFGTADQGQIPKEIDKEYCAKQTLELIDILKPKVVLLLGDQCRDLFNKMGEAPKLEEIVPQSISYCYYKEKYHILSIKHTAFRYSSYEMKIIGNTISYAIDNHSKRLEKTLLYQFICKEANGRAWFLKAMINNNRSYQNIYNEKTVYHEFYTRQKDGKWISSNDRIVIDLTPEEDRKQYVVLLFTRQNNEEKTKKLISGIWPNEEFHPWEQNKSRHVHEVISFEESNEEIKHKMERVLHEVRAYRDREYSINQ